MFINGVKTLLFSTIKSQEILTLHSFDAAVLEYCAETNAVLKEGSAPAGIPLERKVVANALGSVLTEVEE